MHPKLMLRLAKLVQSGVRPSVSVFGRDNENKAKAVSWLRGWPMRDNSPCYPSDLTNEQAADIVRAFIR